MNKGEELIKEYVKNGGRLFTINNIGTYRDGGTKIIDCNNSYTFYIDKNVKSFHLSYPTISENEITDKLLINYLIDRINSYVNKCEDQVKFNKNLLEEISQKQI